jgi:hypothetical protein
MAFFSKRPTEPPTDQGWLAAGHQRFERTKGRHFGSPETMAAGGDQAIGKGDLAAAVFFYAKAIDIAQTWSFGTYAGERSVGQDERIFQAYANALEDVKAGHPRADLYGRWNNESGETTLHMMYGVALEQDRRGRPVGELVKLLKRAVNTCEVGWSEHWVPM